MEIINVNLYGGKGLFGGKETPLEASIIYCDKYEECSYFKNYQCLNVRAPFSSRCKYGRISDVKGYTSRASKYHEFRKKWREHEKYNKLNYPPNKLGVIGDVVVFPYPYARIKLTENGELTINDPTFESDVAYIERDKFTVDFINKICMFKPCAFMGGVIRDYQNKIVPLFLAHLKELLPNIYSELTDKYGNLAKEVNYVGRKAFLNTINPSSVYYKSSSYPQFNEEWYWDGEMLTYSKGYVHDFNITNDYEVLAIKIKPSDKSIIKVTSNDQVSERTLFVD